jgi:hypothetical protein
MYKKTALSIFISLIIHHVIAQQNTLNGYVTEKGSKEQLIGTTIYIPKLQNGTTTNNYGFYSITLPKDSFDIVISMVGYQKKFYRIGLDKNITLNIELDPANELGEVLITNEKTNRITDNAQMSVIQIPVEQIKDIPAFMGEKDVLKVVQLMPGVQKGSEGNSGIYVRGGGSDQNLIILDDAPVYNAFHLFGFFSLFNGDALKSVELTKGGFPARYGGRLSSVLDMGMKEGNKQQFHAEAGIGLLSSRLTLEGPIVKNKSSFLISARRTYIDALIYPFLPKEEKFGYYFYDLNAKVNYDFGHKNKIYLSGYFGKDKFYGAINHDDEKDEFGLYWGNATATARWNHLYTNKLFSNTSFIFSNYNFNIFEDYSFDNKSYYNRLYSGIRDLTLKHDFDYALHQDHFIKAGIIIQQHHFTPSGLTVKNEAFPEDNKNRKITYDAIESGVYIEDNVRITSRWKANVGIRASSFIVKNKRYINPEPRVSTNYMLKEDLSIKASYAVMNQYIHLLSSTGAGLPTDLWVPSTDSIAPQHSEQVALGIAKEFLPRNLTLTVEAYYKKSKNIIAYKEGATFLNVDPVENDDDISWEDNVTSGQGWSYGAEVFLQRKSGKLTGWVGYTLSWTKLQFDELNFGKEYYARYDRRHDISVVAIYKINKGITLSATWVYGTGNAITLPKAEYDAPTHNPGHSTPDYGSNFIFATDFGEKNSFRMAAYHRADIGVQFYKKLKRCERTFELSFYNVYNRHNPYFYYIGGSNDKRVLKQVSLFPVLPSVSWTYKF